MPREPGEQSYLWDMLESARFVVTMTAGMSFEGSPLSQLTKGPLTRPRTTDYGQLTSCGEQKRGQPGREEIPSD